MCEWPMLNDYFPPLKFSRKEPKTWNNGKEVPRLDLTSSTTPGQQIHKFDHTRTANSCDWMPCPRAAIPLVDCPHSLVYLHLPVVEGLIFCISATPHLETSFQLFQFSTHNWIYYVASSWNNGKEVPRWEVAKIQKMSPTTTGRCK